MTTLGLEEEYLLLEPVSGLPAHRATEVQELLEAVPEISEDEIQRALARKLQMIDDDLLLRSPSLTAGRCGRTPRSAPAKPPLR